MRTLLTPVLLDFLISEGYKYCFSKTDCVNSSDANVAITLTPVKSNSITTEFSIGFDAYYHIEKEPAQLAKGVDNTLVMVEIENHQLPLYINFFMEKLAS